MDRDTVTKPGAQIGFISYVLLPMFKSLVKVMTMICLNTFYIMIGFIKKKNFPCGKS